MYIIIKILLILSIFFLFFEGFILPIGTSSYILYNNFIIISLFIFYVTIARKQFIKQLKILYKKTPFKYFAYFIFWLIADSILLIFQHKANLLIFYYLIGKLSVSTLFCYLISSVFIPKYLTIKSSIKILFSFIIFSFIFAIMGYLGDSYNIKLLQTPMNIFSNFKAALMNVEIMLDSVSGSARARGIFHEPGSFARFLFVFSPIIYSVCLSKYKIFDNNKINIIIKKSTIPLFVLCLILTKSPIFLIFTLIFSIIYFKKQIFKIETAIILILSSVCIFYFQPDFENSYLYRIVNTISSINDFYSFSQIEPSLASRIVSYVNSFIVFLHKPFIGYGYDNVRFYLLNQFLNSPLPLTKENIVALEVGLTTNTGVPYTRSLLFGLLPETGIIGTFLYFLFLIKNIKFIDKLKNYFSGTELKFLEGLKLSIICIIATSFYIPSFATAYIYLLFGLICSFVMQYYFTQQKIHKQIS